MSSDDEFGGLLDRETVLAGLPARRANTLLFLIESRTAHLVAKSRQAMERFLTQGAAEERELAFFEAFALGSEPPLRPTIQDLERYAPQWAPLVPENPRVQAAVAHRLGEKYQFTYQTVPGIRAALGLDDALVQQAFQRLYHQPLATIFAARTTPGNRLRWGWAALSGWLENLPPFWTAYSLTLTETVGATILALPIAVAEIGPLAGVLILVVLGVINMLTIAFLSEAVSRSGTIRYGSAFIGRVVNDFLGRAGTLVLTLGLLALCFLVVQAYYIGFATTLEGATRVPAVVWVALLFLVGLYFLWRESLSATVASSLVVGAVNISLIVVISLLAFTHLRPANLFYADVPFLGGRPLDPATLELVFGVILAAYLGHMSLSGCARVVLRRDPSSRSLIWGTVAALATAMFLYCLFVLAANGATSSRVLAHEPGTALDPLAAQVGPIVYVLGSVLVILGLGMASIHFSVGLFNLIREWLPSPARPVVVLPRRRGSLLFHERGRGGADDGLRLGVIYLGLSGDKPRFRLDIELDGELHRLETTAAGRWEVLNRNGGSPLLARDPNLLDRGNHLALEIMGAVRAALEELATQGLVAEVSLEGEPRYEARSATRRGRQLPQQIWQALGEERGSTPTAETSRPSQAAGISGPFRKLLSSEYGLFFLGAGPTAAAFLLAEWQLLTGSGSYTELLGVIGAVVVPLLGGVFPVLLLVASRQKGERVPGGIYRFLGNPVLLVGIYVLFLISIFVHGLVIWEDPVQRAGALL